MSEYINHIPDVMSHYDCKILTIMKEMRNKRTDSMKIKINKHNNHLYRDCIFCSGKMNVIINPQYDDNNIISTSKCKKCSSEIIITTHRNNYIITDDHNGDTIDVTP